MFRSTVVLVFALCATLFISCESSGHEGASGAEKQRKAKTNWNIPEHGVNQNGLPTISLMTWLEECKEGEWFAELRLYQTGAKEVPGLEIFYKVGGTAKNGYDYTNVNSSIKMLPHTYNDIFDYGFNYRHIDPNKNTYNRTSIYLDAIPDKLVEGDETFTVTLEKNPNYNIDPDFNSVTIIIQDGDIPDVQFTVPASEGKESVKRPNIEVSLSKPWNKNVTVEYDYYTVLADAGEDFNLKAGKVVIPAGRVKTKIPLTIKDDKTPEVDEVVVVQLRNAKEANLYINEKHFYTIKNDDGEVKRNIINDKIYGVLLGSRGGSSLGAVVEMIVSEDQIQKLYGGSLTEFIPYVHNRHIRWAHPKGGTEDGIERQKLIATSIVEKQDRISADDLMDTWRKHGELRDMYWLTQPYDRVIMRFAKWGFPHSELPISRYGGPYELGEHIHLTARSFHPISCINAGDPEGAIEDMKEIGLLYYASEKDHAFEWGAVYNTALTLAMLPDATVESVIEESLKKASPEIREEIEYALAIADKYDDPMDVKFWKEVNSMYADPNSKYFADTRIPRYVQSSVYENVTMAFVFFKATKGDLQQSIIVSSNRGRDTDCSAASAAGLTGALTGSTKISKEWIDVLEQGNKDNEYSNSHLSNRVTADAIYLALQNKLRRMKKEVAAAGDNLSEKMARQKKYVEMMEGLEVI